MTIPPQAALERMIAAFEAHFHAALSTESAASPHLLEAEQRLRDAFFTYDDAIFNAFGVDLPFDLLSDDDYDEDDYDFDDDDIIPLDFDDVDDEDYDDDEDDDDDDDFDDDDLDEDDYDDEDDCEDCD
ncbi:MAG: DNA primase [Actinomycetaceae bacterium]|nr:DNA primase [Actinomycetaceae bacterium]